MQTRKFELSCAIPDLWRLLTLQGVSKHRIEMHDHEFNSNFFLFTKKLFSTQLNTYSFAFRARKSNNKCNLAYLLSVPYFFFYFFYSMFFFIPFGLVSVLSQFIFTYFATVRSFLHTINNFEAGHQATRKLAKGVGCQRHLKYLKMQINLLIFLDSNFSNGDKWV